MRISPGWKMFFVILLAVTILLYVTLYRLKGTPGAPTRNHQRVRSDGMAINHNPRDHQP
jgi:uncharacterized protein YpmS